MKRHSKELHELARRAFGAGGFDESKRTKLYFVSDAKGVFMATTSGPSAYQAWVTLPTSEERTLERSDFGVLACTEPESDEEGSRLRTYDSAWHDDFSIKRALKNGDIYGINFFLG
jgi:hypothetical protein